jgi:hypothetical protein
MNDARPGAIGQRREQDARLLERLVSRHLG